MPTTEDIAIRPVTTKFAARCPTLRLSIFEPPRRLASWLLRGETSGRFAACGGFLLAGLLSVWMTVATGLPSYAKSTTCAEVDAEVDAHDSEEVGFVCAAAKVAVVTLAGCCLDQRTRLTIRIAVDPDDPSIARSYGSYDPTSNLITLTSLALTAKRLKSDESRVHIKPSEYYRSVVIHEVAHSILLTHPASRGLSWPAHEYLAYALQIDALSELSKAELLKPYRESRALTTLVPDEMLLYMNPTAFAATSYQHFKMLGEQCNAIKRVLKGEVDFTRPYD